MSSYTFRDKFLVYDGKAVKLVEEMPVHKFRSNPVALVPVGGEEGTGLVVAVYGDGTLALVTPTLHKVEEIDGKKTDGQQEQFLAAGVAAHGREVAVAIWDSTSQSYKVKLYRLEKYSLRLVGSAPLAPPRMGEVLCGLAHSGSQLTCVWMDGNLQIYGPQEEGLALVQSCKLNGFDFGVMKRGSGTEDLRSIPLGVSVCGSVGGSDLVAVVGPRSGAKGLKYAVIDTRTGMAQSSGVLYDKMEVKSPVKLIVKDGSVGKVQGMLEGKLLGEEIITIQSQSLAGRLGVKRSKPASRKRKLALETSSPAKHMKCDHENELMREVLTTNLGSVTFSMPAWAKLLLEVPHERVQDILASTPIVSKIPLEKLALSSPKKNGRLQEAMISETVKELMETLTQPCICDGNTLDQSIKILQDCKERGIVLTVDLVGVTAGAIARNGDCWEKLAKLTKEFPVKSLAQCPDLLPSLIRSSELDLFESVLDSVEVLGADELKETLHGIFQSSQNPDMVECQVQHYDRVESSALASVSGLENERREVIQSKLPMVQREVAMVEKFSHLEVLLHPLVRVPADPVCLSEAFCDLAAEEARRLLIYLGKWIQKELGFMPMISSHKEKRWKLPNIGTVLEWLNVLVSSQTSALSRGQEMKVVENVLQSIQGWQKCINAGLKCKSALEAMFQMKPPSKRSHADPLYKISILDLGLES